MAAQVDIRRFAEKFKKDVVLVKRKVALELISRIIARSPVDTGRFVNNWQTDIDTVPSGELGGNDPTGGAARSRAAGKVATSKEGDTIWFVNNLPYARRLEYGWSKQAPAGMVRVTVEEFAKIFDTVTKDVFSRK